jgi:hypothetical protein
MNTPIYVISAQADRSAEHLETVWDALSDYREVYIPEGKDESFDAIWDDITFAMEELRVALGLPDPVEADNTARTLTHAAATLHNADNALLIARRHTPVSDRPDTVDVVRADISSALNAIAAVIGQEAMLSADWPAESESAAENMPTVMLNPHHERLATRGNGYFTHSQEGQSLGCYSVPHDFADPEAGHVRLYADRPQILLTRDEALTLAQMLTRAAERLTQ